MNGERVRREGRRREMRVGTFEKRVVLGERVRERKGKKEREREKKEEKGGTRKFAAAY